MRTLRRLVALGLASVLFSATPHIHRLPAAGIAGAVTFARPGAADGWRCLTSATYRYNLRTEAPDSRLVAERPEAAADDAFRNGTFIAEQVAIALGADRAEVQGHLLSRSGQMTPRVVTLLAIVAQPMSVDLPWQAVSTCDAGLRAWWVVAG